VQAATLQAAGKPLLALTAADLMSTPVMTILQETSLREAARLLSRSSISGAPVVDTEGRCVGVLSSSDFITWAVKGREPGEEGKPVSFIAPWGELIHIDDSPDHPISHYMTAQPVTVGPKASIGELALKMVDAHIHRILVVVDQNRPRGIVTSTDILAAVAHAAKKQEAEAGRGKETRAQRSRK
jgi:CBS domain-containing protein